MRRIGKLLGNVVKADKLTLAHTLGQFGQVCVEIDLQKPLAPHVEIEGFAYDVVYEGMSMIYFNCGGFGHIKLNCPYQKIFPTEKSTTDNLEEENMNMEKPNPDLVIMTESISSPMLC